MIMKWGVRIATAVCSPPYAITLPSKYSVQICLTEPRVLSKKCIFGTRIWHWSLHNIFGTNLFGTSVFGKSGRTHDAEHVKPKNFTYCHAEVPIEISARQDKQLIIDPHWNVSSIFVAQGKQLKSELVPVQNIANGSRTQIIHRVYPAHLQSDHV